MITVILAAGHSRRFREKGWAKTKTVLPMPDGRTLLEWQLERLPPSRQVIYVGRREYRAWEWPYIMKHDLVKKVQQPTFCHWIKDPTEGPLDGLWHIRSFINKDEELLITYNDEILGKQTYLDFIENSYWVVDASVVALDSSDERYTRIPYSKKYACGCTYWFASGRKFVKLMKKNEKGENNGVPDIVYKSQTWRTFIPSMDDVIELGTPEEYKYWMAEQGKPVEEW